VDQVEIVAMNISKYNNYNSSSNNNKIA